MIDETAMRQILADYNAQFDSPGKAAKACGMALSPYKYMLKGNAGGVDIQPSWLVYMGYTRVKRYKGYDRHKKCYVYLSTNEVFEWISNEVEAAGSTLYALADKLELPTTWLYQIPKRKSLRTPVMNALGLREVWMYEELQPIMASAQRAIFERGK